MTSTKMLMALLWIFFYGSQVVGENDRNLLPNKTLFGVGYDVALAPKISRYLGPGDSSALKGLHRVSLDILYPYYRFLAVGAAFDYTYIQSNKDKNVRLSISPEPGKITTQFLGISARIRPQYPIHFSHTDLIFYTEAQLGLNTSSPIAFGTQPLANYTYDNTSNIPSPFPLAFEATPKVGLQVFAYQFFAVDVAFGFRTMWVVHPMVSPPKKLAEGLAKDSRKAIWNDVSAMFLQAGLKFAF
jgi:hypothetical protein